MKSKRSKACDISQKTKKKVWERDGQKCILCGNRESMPNAHYVSRAKGGLGIEENIVTLCSKCHFSFDNTIKRKDIKKYIAVYLSAKYENWDEKKLTYEKGAKNGL